MNTKKPLALSEIFLVISLSIIFAVFQAPSVSAAPVCCQKTKTNDYCQYVDENDCAADSAKAPTSCDQTSFCKAGCCFNQGGDGYCYANTPKASCQLSFNGTYSSDATCKQTAECNLGCCVLGTQTVFTTEVRCRGLTAQYPELPMDFRRDVPTEQACTDIARSSEQGCCVQGPNACSYGAKATCSTPRGENTGFFKDQYCSQISTCSCAPSNPALGGKGDQQSTMCLANEDSVYWKDSCGNPEGVKEQCDYTKGTLCDDSDKDGRFSCESLDCKTTETKPLSLSLPGAAGNKNALKNNLLRNGESYCLYDSPDQGVDDPKIKGIVGSRSPVGSRYHRGVCINGQELIEPCADFRKEFCVAGTVKNTGLNEELTAAQCIKNEWQSCITQCNTANSYTMKEEQYKEALQSDMQCCLDTSRRDCSWLGNKCIPKVGPGFQFWQDDGASTCSQANVECPVVLVCPGTSAWLGVCDVSEPWKAVAASLAKIGLGLLLAAAITSATGGTGMGVALLVSGADITIKEIAKGVEGTYGWYVVSGKECLSKDFLNAANNVCRSYGDCGANINYDEKISMTGFTNTRSFNKEFRAGALLDTPTIPKGTLSLAWKDAKKVDENPGTLDWKTSVDSKQAWEKGKAFFDFTLKEEVTFWDRFNQKVAGLVVSGVLIHLPAIVGGFFGGGGGPIFLAGKIIVGGVTALVNFVGGVFSQGAGIAAEQAAKSSFETLTSKLRTSAFTRGIVEEGLGEGAEELLEEASEEAAEKAAEEVTEKAVEKGANQALAAEFASGFNAASWVDLAYETIDTIGERTQVEKVKATCSVWVPPKVETKDQCERCNPDYPGYQNEKGIATNARAYLPCTEYRCKSLGATCELVNQGTQDERCVSTSKYDTAPPVIDAWNEGFDLNYQNKIKKLPGVNGIKIDADIPIYQKILLALKTDQPAQCKMSFKPGVRYKDMEPFYFSSPTYKTTHRQAIFWPAQTNITNSSITLSKGGGDYKLYVRCENPKGLATENDYVIQFTISKEPDLTAPQILTTSLGKEAYLTAGHNKTDVTLFTNEPATCKWSLSPQAYNDMPATNTCKVINPNTYGEYECHYRDTPAGNVGPALSVQTPRAGTAAFVYFKCQDLQAKPNTMVEPFKLTLRGSDPLNITTLGPTGQIYTSLAIENITLKVETTGGAFLDGKATCRYTQRESFKHTIQNMDDTFLFTNSSVHTQPLVLATGDHTFYAGCNDRAGNIAYASTSFSVLADLHPPRIIKAQKTDQPRTFQLVIDEDASCSFSTKDPAFKYDDGNKMIKDGTLHSTTEESTTYYVKCRDNYQNTNEPAIMITFL